MFNLEKSIADWRKQMLAAGIQSPVPLEELESHLREEIEQLVKSGLNQYEAFNSAVQKIGQAGLLKTEFKQAGGLIDWLGENKSERINQILGAIWFAQCTWFLIRFATSPEAAVIVLFFPHYWQFFTVFFTLLSSAGVIGSMRLFRGAKFGVSVIRIIAVVEFLLCAFEYAADDGSFESPKYWLRILAIFDLITIWALRSPSVKNPNVAAG